ncbi:hypothetical protein TNCV_3551191 [Trichonephila clavipes]|nr:hypothetical protein TNCV_3551191 [Trichonephila clavipes]
MEKWLAKSFKKSYNCTNSQPNKPAKIMDYYRPISYKYNVRYPLDKWFFIYTNGSTEDAIENAGAGNYSNAFSISYPVGMCVLDNFDDEIAAISFAIDKLESCSECNIVFFIDSQAAISSLINSRYNEKMH